MKKSVFMITGAETLASAVSVLLRILEQNGVHAQTKRVGIFFVLQYSYDTIYAIFFQKVMQEYNWRANARSQSLATTKNNMHL